MISFSHPRHFQGQKILNYGYHEISLCHLIHWFNRMLFLGFAEFSQDQGVHKMEWSNLMTLLVHNCTHICIYKHSHWSILLEYAGIQWNGPIPAGICRASKVSINAGVHQLWHRGIPANTNLSVIIIQIKTYMDLDQFWSACGYKYEESSTLMGVTINHTSPCVSWCWWEWHSIVMLTPRV